MKTKSAKPRLPAVKKMVTLKLTIDDRHPGAINFLSHYVERLQAAGVEIIGPLPPKPTGPVSAEVDRALNAMVKGRKRSGGPQVIEYVIDDQ